MQTAKAQISLCIQTVWLAHSLSANRIIGYGKCPKNSNTKASDKMTYANSVDPEGAVWSGSTLFAIPLNI